MAEQTNKYGLTASQWAQYQNDQKPWLARGVSWAQSPLYWAWANNINGAGGGTIPVGGSYDGSAFIATQQAMDTAAIKNAEAARRAQEENARVIEAQRQREADVERNAAIVAADYARLKAQKTTYVSSDKKAGTSGASGSGAQKLAAQTKVVTDKNGTRAAEASKGTDAKQSAAANQKKVSATETKTINTPQKVVTKSNTVADVKKLTGAEKIAQANKTQETKKATVLKDIKSGIESSGGKGTGESNIKIGTTGVDRATLDAQYAQKLAGKYNPTQIKITTSGKTRVVEQGTVTDPDMVKQIKQAQAEIAKATELRNKFIEKADKSGNVIPAIISGGSGGTGKGNVRIVQTDKSGNITAVSGTASEYRAAASQLKAAQEKVAQETKKSRAELAYEKQITYDKKAASSGNALESTLAKIDLAVRPAVMQFGKGVTIGFKAGIGQELTETEYTNLQALTGIGTKKEYTYTKQISEGLSKLQSEVDRGYNRVSGAVSPAIKSARDIYSGVTGTIGAGIESGNKLIVGGVASVVPSLRQYQSEYEATQRAVKSPTAPKTITFGGKSHDITMLTKFAENTKSGIKGADKTASKIAYDVSQSPTLIKSALQEAEYLATHRKAIIPTLGFAAAAIPTGLAKSAYDNPVELAATLATQEAALRSAAIVAGGGLKLVGAGTGIVDLSTKVMNAEKFADRVPMKSKGELTETALSGKRINVVRSEPRNIGREMKLNIPRGGGELDALGKAISSQPISFVSVDTGKISTTSTQFLKAAAINSGKSKATSGGILKLPERVINDIHGFVSPTTYASIIKMQGVQTVRIPQKLYSSVKKSIAENDGKFLDEYKRIEKIAQKQADKFNEPIAIPSPKTANGVLQQENEMVLVFPKKSINKSKSGESFVKISKKRFSGFTKEGYPITKISIGKMKAPDSVPVSIAKNLKHNYNLRVDKYGIYNADDQAASVLTQIQRDLELTGKKLNFPGSYEYGKHGIEHSESVTANLIKLEREFKTGKMPDEYARDLGYYHDIGKVGPQDQLYGDHGVSAARSIRAGKIPSLEGKSKNYLNKLADDLSRHDEINKISIGNIKRGLKTKFLYRPSKAAKMLSNADRYDLTRFGVKVNKSKIFDLSKDETSIARTLSKFEDGINKLKVDTSAELLAVKTTKVTGKNKMEIGYKKRVSDDGIKFSSRKTGKSGIEYRGLYGVVTRRSKPRGLVVSPKPKSKTPPTDKTTWYNKNNTGKQLSTKNAAYEYENLKNKFSAYADPKGDLYYPGKTHGSGYTPKPAPYKPPKAGYKPKPYKYDSGYGYTPKPKGYEPGAYYPDKKGGGYYPPPHEPGYYPPGYTPPGYTPPGYTPPYTPPKPPVKYGGYSPGKTKTPPPTPSKVIPKKEKSYSAEIRALKEAISKEKRMIKNKIGTLIY